jgi:hydroxyacylglutathione hydrolase
MGTAGSRWIGAPYDAAGRASDVAGKRPSVTRLLAGLPAAACCIGGSLPIDAERERRSDLSRASPGRDSRPCRALTTLRSQGLPRNADDDYHRVMVPEISGVISPIRALGVAGSPGVSVVATRDERWDARSYLVSSATDAVLIDGNGNLGPLVDHARAQGLDLHAALLTHTHEDHVAGIAELRASGIPVMAHAGAPGGFHDRDMQAGEVVRFGELEIEPIHLPGHDAAQFAYRAGGVVATGDSIYRHTVAGHAEPSEASFTEHMGGIDLRILTLAPDIVILPGHGAATTVAEELTSNPFVRLFRGPHVPPASRACRVGGPFGLWEAELVLLAVDYDGGRKALVRFPTIGRSIVPGSQLYTTDGQPWPVDG